MGTSNSMALINGEYTVSVTMKDLVMIGLVVMNVILIIMVIIKCRMETKNKIKEWCYNEHFIMIIIVFVFGINVVHLVIYLCGITCHAVICLCFMIIMVG